MTKFLPVLLGSVVNMDKMLEGLRTGYLTSLFVTPQHGERALHPSLSTK